MHHNRRRFHEQIHDKVHAVRIIYPFPSPPHPSHRLALKHVAEGGTLAEEVISSIRTAHAFGTQKVLSGLYDVYVNEAGRINAKSAIFHGIGLGVFFFVIYSAYGLGK